VTGRIEKGVELFKAGYAPFIMVMMNKAIELGVPSPAIIPELRSQST